MRWLHLSDLNFGVHSANLGAIRDKILDLAYRLEPVNTLFVTGNLVAASEDEKAYARNLEEASEYLKSIQAKFNIPKDRTFLVPGPHDRLDDTILGYALEGERNRYSSNEGEIKPAMLGLIHKAELPFRRIYEEVCGRTYPGEHYACTLKDLRILCLHTSLLSGGRNAGRDEKGNDAECKTDLIIGRKLLNKLHGEERKFSLTSETDDRLPVIALAHHDFSCLHPDESNALELKLKNLGATLYLCGGHSRAFSTIQETIRSNKDKLRVFGCGIFVPQGGESEAKQASLLVGEVNDTSSYVQAYKWSSYVQAWLTDNEFSYQYDETRAQDGRIYYPTRPFDRIPDPTTIWNKYLRYLKKRCDQIEPVTAVPTGNASEPSTPLSKVFVPLSLDCTTFSDEISRLEQRGSGIPLEREGDKARTGNKFSEAIPRKGRVLSCILSETGGGKSTLVNWVACAYGYAIAEGGRETHLPPRSLYPVWIRCREIPHSALQSPVGSLAATFESLSRKVGSEKQPVRESEIKEFCDFLEKTAAEGTALLLIDGLDELHDRVEQRNFVAQLSDYLRTHSKANVLLTTRFPGLYALAEKSGNEKSLKPKPVFSEFQWYRIAPMNEEQIRWFCDNSLSGARANVSDHALENKIGRLLDTPEIRAMAENPMLLTLMLMVWQRTGRTPDRRDILFREALDTLMERWNAEAQGFDIQEMVCLLSSIAFFMMTDYASQIGEENLRERIENLLEKRTDLFYQLRSSEQALGFLQDGQIFHACGKSESGEVIYEFAQRYLQEYLAALAVVRSCYPAYPEMPEESRPGEILLPYMSREHWAMKNVFALVAMMSQPCARLICRELMRKIRECRRDSEEYRYLRHLLLRIPAYGVPLTDEAVREILDCCFPERIRKEDIESLAWILYSRYQSFMIKRFKKMGNERFSRSGDKPGDYEDYWDAVAELLSGQYEPTVRSGVLTPLQFYWQNQNNPDPACRAHALSLLAAALWVPPFRLNGHKIHPSQSIEELDEAKRQQLRDSLLPLFNDQDFRVHMQFLRLLGQRQQLENLGLLKKSDYPDYLRVYLRFMNERAQIPPRLHLNHIAHVLEELTGSDQTGPFYLSETALDAITNHLEEDAEGDGRDGAVLYLQLLSVALLTVACHAPVPKQCRLYGLIRLERRRTWAARPNEEGLERHTFRYRKALVQMIRNGWICSAEERNAAWRCVWEADFDVAEHISRHGDPDGVKLRAFLKETNSNRTEFPYSAETLSDLMQKIGELLAMDDSGIVRH